MAERAGCAASSLLLPAARYPSLLNIDVDDACYHYCPPLSDHVVRLKFLSVGNQANIATGAWVVVCDDGKELILENSGSPAASKIDAKEVHERANAPTHQQGTNQPGRCINRSATHAPRSSRPIGTMKRSAFSSILWPAGSTWRSRRENPAISSSSARRAARARHVVKKQVRSACGSAPDEMLWNLYRCTNTCSLPAVSLPQLLEIPLCTPAVGVGKCLPVSVERTDDCARPTMGNQAGQPVGTSRCCVSAFLQENRQAMTATSASAA